MMLLAEVRSCILAVAEMSRDLSRMALTPSHTSHLELPPNPNRASSLPNKRRIKIINDTCAEMFAGFDHALEQANTANNIVGTSGQLDDDPST